MPMRLYRVIIEGWVPAEDYGGEGRAIEPDEWPPDEILAEMVGIHIYATLVDTIKGHTLEDEEGSDGI